jgi:hypothetical protein
VETKVTAFTDHFAVVLRLATDVLFQELLEDEYLPAKRKKVLRDLKGAMG